MSTNDEIYQLAKDEALVKKQKKPKDLGLFVYAFRELQTLHPEGINKKA